MLGRRSAVVAVLCVSCSSGDGSDNPVVAEDTGTTVVDSTTSDTTTDTTTEDTTVAETEPLDTSVAETTTADSTTTETAIVETSVVDTSVVDTTVVDSFVADTFVADTAVVDMGMPEAGPPPAPSCTLHPFYFEDNAVSAANASGRVAVSSICKAAFPPPGMGSSLACATDGAKDVFISVYDAACAHKWSVAFKSNGDDGVGGVAVNTAGDVFSVGVISGSHDFGGGAVSGPYIAKRAAADGAHVYAKALVVSGSATALGPAKVQTDTAGNAYVFMRLGGATTVDLGSGSTTTSDRAIGVIKFDPTGTRVFGKVYGGAAGSEMETGSMRVDGAGNIYIAGTAKGTIDFGSGKSVVASGKDAFLAKLDSSGVAQYALRYGDSMSQGVNELALDNLGNVILLGTINAGSTLNFGTTSATELTAPSGSGRAYLAKLATADGAHVWSKLLPFGALGGSVFLGSDTAGSVLVTGGFAGSIDFGGGSVTSSGSTDMFVAKYSALGSFLWVRTVGQATDTRPDQGWGVDGFGATNELWVSGLVRNYPTEYDFGGGKKVSLLFLAKLPAF
jgi:hypothetical protein